MAINRGNVQAFAAKVGTGNNLYYKSKDFENARRMRPILWIKDGAPIDVVMFLEGWHVVQAKGENGKPMAVERPIRFETEAVIPESIDWKMSSYKGGKETPQTPKPNVGMIVWDYTLKQLKIATFGQVSVVRKISSLLSPTNEDGSSNEAFEEDLTKVDLVISKGATDKEGYNIFTKALKDQSLSPDCLHALEDFRWSWEAFMACEKLEEGEGFTWNDVVDAVPDNPNSKPVTKKDYSKPAAASKNTSEEKTGELLPDFNYNKDWKNVKTSKGTLIGSLDIDRLKEYRAQFEAKEGFNPKGPIYIAILSGIKDFTEKDGQESDSDVEEEDAAW